MIAALHLTAGVIAGGIFPVQFLLLLIAGTLLECSAAAIVHGFAFGATQALLLLLVLQVGYLLGSYLRNLVEVSLNNAGGRGDLRGRSDEAVGLSVLPRHGADSVDHIRIDLHDDAFEKCAAFRRSGLISMDQGRHKRSVVHHDDLDIASQ